MSERQYSAPPIIDSIIELRFEDAIADDVRDRVSKRLAAKYPLEGELTQQHIRVEVGAGSIATHAAVQERMIQRRNSEGPELVQIGTRVLDVASGAPYVGWEALFERFVEDWAIAKKIWKYRKISRIGVRYINRIDLEFSETGVVDYEKYLNLRINLPEEFPPINRYELSFQSVLHDIKCGVTVKSASAPPAVPGRFSFILDIDVGRNFEVPQKDAEVRKLLSKMRKAKNSLFETFITEEAREIFNAG